MTKMIITMYGTAKEQNRYSRRTDIIKGVMTNQEQAKMMKEGRKEEIQ